VLLTAATVLFAVGVLVERPATDTLSRGGSALLWRRRAHVGASVRASGSIRGAEGWVEKGVLFVRAALMGPTRALPGDQKGWVEGRQRR